ncbi:hypothetical protein IFM89_029429 [Coptis chinensis]|uniref:Uncharacterized protein n=1 Tax=Coptis chinensis TaxID=261450 RepID=A0A835INC5_9MAGN|nr:hypothetical protein IFM89_029429 [Coptis chinensis]
MRKVSYRYSSKEIVCVVFSVGNEEWEMCGHGSDFGWIQMAEPVMELELYTKATHGSLVWHHQDADPGFGSINSSKGDVGPSRKCTGK